MIGIYAITHTDSGRVYVGSSATIQLRMDRHRSSLRAGTHHNRHLQRAWNLYGSGAFVFSVLEVIESIDKLIEREQYHYGRFEDVYNISAFVDSPMRGRTSTSETRAKISAAGVGRTHTIDTLKKMSASAKARCVTPSMIVGFARIKASWRAARPDGRGAHVTPHTAETRAKMKAAWVLRKSRGTSLETRERCRAAQSGRTHTVETREKMSASGKTAWTRPKAVA